MTIPYLWACTHIRNFFRICCLVLQAAEAEMIRFYKEVIRNIYLYGSLLNIIVLIIVVVIYIRLK